MKRSPAVERSFQAASHGHPNAWRNTRRDAGKRKPMTATVEVYSTSFCRHCVAMREFLERHGIEYTEYRLDLLPLEREQMVRRCGATSVPQILINGAPVGGYEELVALHARGELNALIAP